MINLNGSITEQNNSIDAFNRGFYWGDSVFDTLKYTAGKLVFWEEHYLRLMASMRIVRMHIPDTFTMEFLENEMRQCLVANHLHEKSALVRLQVYRLQGQTLLPQGKKVGYCINVQELGMPFYQNLDVPYEVELFKDFYLQADLLSNLKLTQKMPQTLGSIFAHENDYQNALMLNNQKNIVGFTNGNVFMVTGTHLVTPPLSDGAINGITRKKLLEAIGKTQGFTVEEKSISTFDLQKADELFLTNTTVGIQSVSKYRKKEYARSVAVNLLGKLNTLVRLG